MGPAPAPEPVRASSVSVPTALPAAPVSMRTAVPIATTAVPIVTTTRAPVVTYTAAPRPTTDIVTVRERGPLDIVTVTPVAPVTTAVAPAASMSYGAAPVYQPAPVGQANSAMDLFNELDVNKDGRV